jgi:hypothetical protein
MSRAWALFRNLTLFRCTAAPYDTNLSFPLGMSFQEAGSCYGQGSAFALGGFSMQCPGVVTATTCAGDVVLLPAVGLGAARSR